MRLPTLPRPVPVSLPGLSRSDLQGVAIGLDEPRLRDPPKEDFETLLRRGMTAEAMCLLELATDDFLAATRLRPGSRRAWEGLAIALRRCGKREGALAAARRAAKLELEPAPTTRAVPAGKIEKSLRRLREKIAASPWRDPSDLLREHLVAHPSDVAAMHALAEFEIEAGDLRTARALLERAVQLAPARLETREAIAGLLLRMRREAEALPHIDCMLAQRPSSEAYRQYKIAALSALGEYGEAARLGETIAAASRRASFWLNHARALRFSGRRAEAIDAYRKCIALDPANGEAYWGLSYVQKAPLSDADLAAMRAQLEAGAPTPVSRFHFHYALGNALEKKAEFPESFVQYTKGAAACRAVNEQDGDLYRAAAHTALIGRLKTVFSSDLLASAATGRPVSPTPIFILGLPRSGSTLLEQIFSSHSQVEATQELPDLHNIVQEIGLEAAAFGADYPECVADFAADEFDRWGQEYLDRTRIYRKTDKPFFVDKMPFNWEHIGLIHLLLPNAKIIDARRHPVACCFSAFKQLIARGAGYSCDLRDMGLYYRDYLDFMAHIDRVRPGLVHRVIYERMVDDTEAEIRRLLAHCGLKFELGCLNFWNTARSVATPSVEQVRQPIFRDALDQWRNYEAWLGPLFDALGDAPARYAG